MSETATASATVASAGCFADSERRAIDEGIDTRWHQLKSGFGLRGTMPLYALVEAGDREAIDLFLREEDGAFPVTATEQAD